jgi:hypothetical protein
VERNLRDALEDFCRPENLDRELRRAMDTLNLDGSPTTQQQQRQE